MKWNEEQLKLVNDFAELYFTPKEIAVILQVDAEEFLLEMEDESSQASIAFLRGRLMAKASIRKKLFLLAGQGSSQAQALVLKLEQESELQIMREEHGG